MSTFNHKVVRVDVVRCIIVFLAMFVDLDRAQKQVVGSACVALANCYLLLEKTAH